MRRGRSDSIHRLPTAATSLTGPAETALPPSAEARDQAWGRLLFYGVVGVLLVPVTWITLHTLARALSETAATQDFWRTEPVWFFSMGLIIWGFFYRGFRGPRLTYVYVFAHEWTHVLATWICGGRLLERPVVRPEGGVVVTNKNNLFITLAPYLIPTYAVVLGLIYMALHHWFTLDPIVSRVFYGMLGFSWAFHITYTLQMSLRSQPDLKTYGTFFSLVFVSLANLLVLCALFIGASETVDWFRFGQDWWAYAKSLASLIPIN